jgi:hypothetical protein
MDLREIGWDVGHWIEHGNEFSDSIKYWEVLV